MARILPDRVSLPGSEAVGVCPWIRSVICRVVGSILSAPEFVILRDPCPVIFSTHRFRHVDHRADACQAIELIAEFKAPCNIFPAAECWILHSFPVKARHAFSYPAAEDLCKIPGFFCGASALAVMVCSEELPGSLRGAVLCISIWIHVPGALRELDDYELGRCHGRRFELALVACHIYSIKSHLHRLSDASQHIDVVLDQLTISGSELFVEPCDPRLILPIIELSGQDALCRIDYGVDALLDESGVVSFVEQVGRPCVSGSV